MAVLIILVMKAAESVVLEMIVLVVLVVTGIIGGKTSTKKVQLPITVYWQV